MTVLIFVQYRYFGTICPEVEKRKTSPLVLVGSADAYDLLVVEILIAACPNTIFVVRNFVESYNSTPTKNGRNLDFF